jgi:hypothetical protein
MKVLKQKRFKFILIALFIPLLTSCIFAWDCLESPAESNICFDNAGNVGIQLVNLSCYDNAQDGIHVIGSLSDFASYRTTEGKHRGPDILKDWQSYLDFYDNDDKDHYLLFMDGKEEILLVWDLRDTTQRWADESLWTVDSTIIEVCGGEMQVQYYNTYRFSDEDFAK